MIKRILTIDNSKTIRDMLMLTLAEAGFEVLQAVDGQDGLDVLGKEQVDVVITDINMPRMDGYEVIRQLRSNPDAQIDADPGTDDRKRSRQEKSCPRGRRYRVDGQAVRSGPADRHHQQGRSVEICETLGSAAHGQLGSIEGHVFRRMQRAPAADRIGPYRHARGNGPDDTINAVFRSVHSVKGGAGIFGFEILSSLRMFSRPCSTRCGAASWRQRRKLSICFCRRTTCFPICRMSRSGEAIPPNRAANAAPALERYSSDNDRRDGGDEDRRLPPISKGSTSCRCVPRSSMRRKSVGDLDL